MTTTPPPSMIEKMAEAIDATRARMDRVRDAVPRSKREPYFDKIPSKGPMKGQHVVGYRTKLLEAQARAAIESMREPTKHQLSAGYDADWASDCDADEIRIGNVYRAMISAALEGK